MICAARTVAFDAGTGGSRGGAPLSCAGPICVGEFYDLTWLCPKGGFGAYGDDPIAGVGEGGLVDGDGSLGVREAVGGVVGMAERTVMLERDCVVLLGLAQGLQSRALGFAGIVCGLPDSRVRDV